MNLDIFTAEEINISLLTNLFPVLSIKGKHNFASYLTGLIEGDGSIIVPTKDITSYKPFFEITFHIDDLILAQNIQSIIGGNIRLKQNYCVLIIKKKSEVLYIMNLLNGKMRTPKIEALHRMITWYNLNYHTKIKILGIDISPLQTNNWLAGFIDADGSFYLNWLLDKKGLATSLQYYMRIAQRKNYSKLNNFFKTSYFIIMQKIANFLYVPLRFRNRLRKSGLTESAYEVRSANYISNYTILSYLLQYPLFSYKYLNINVQLNLLRLSLNKNYKLSNGLSNLENLKLKSKGYNLSSDKRVKYHSNHISIYFPYNNKKKNI